MKCDLCSHRELQATNNLLCESCGEMIQRLLAVQTRMGPPESQNVRAAAAPATKASPWGQYQY